MLPYLHPALARILRRSRRLERFFASLDQASRLDFDRYIREAKRDETRKRRLEHIMEHLSETMEAERDLPPLLRRAFAGNARARQGWELMPQTRRRSYLLNLFRSRYLDTRARCLELMLEDFVRYADRRGEDRVIGKTGDLS